jgi:hypothetical protein
MNNEKKELLRYIWNEYGEALIAILMLPFGIPAAIMNRKLHNVPLSRIKITKVLLLFLFGILEIILLFTFFLLLMDHIGFLSLGLGHSHGKRILIEFIVLWLAAGTLLFLSIARQGNWQIRSNLEQDPKDNATNL